MLDLPCLACGCSTGLIAITIVRRWGKRHALSIPGRLCKPCTETMLRQAEAAKARPALKEPWTRRVRPRHFACTVCGGPGEAIRPEAQYCSRRCQYRARIRARAARAA